MRTALAAAILVSLLALGSPDNALAQAAAPYQPAPADGVVLVRGGTRIELLVDSMALGGTELEMARVVFPRIRGGVARHHRHASIELIYLLSGELDHVVNGQAYRLRPGMVGIARPQDSVAHRVMSDDAVRALVIWTPAQPHSAGFRFGRRYRPAAGQSWPAAQRVNHCIRTRERC